MATAKITKRTVDAAGPTGRNYVVYDSALPGFGLRVTAAGVKSWIVEYRPGAGGRGVAKRRYTFASAAVMPAEQARKTARSLLQRIGQGFDPLAAQEEERASPTVCDALERFLVEHVDSKRKASTASLYRYLARTYIEPELGRLKLRNVTSRDVLRLHHKMRDKPFAANRVVAVIGSLYSWGAKAGLVDRHANPTHGIEKNREQGRERYLSSEEMERLGATLKLAETVGLPWSVDETKPTAKHLAKPGNRVTIISPMATEAIRLLILTGCRLREILHLRWSDVDLERGMLHLADSKTGRKSVILNGPALAILADLPRAGVYVIAGADPAKPRSDLKKPWEAIRAYAQLDGVRLHDLRHSFASVGAGAGLGLPIVGKLLGHTQASTTQRYAHLDADPLRRASNAIGTAIAAALSGIRENDSDGLTE